MQEEKMKTLECIITQEDCRPIFWENGRMFCSDSCADEYVGEDPEDGDNGGEKWYIYAVPFEFKAVGKKYGQHMDSHLSGILGSSYHGDISDFSVYVDREYDEEIEGYPISGSAILRTSWKGERLTSDDLRTFICAIIDENSTAEWSVVKNFEVTDLLENKRRK